MSPAPTPTPTSLSPHELVHSVAVRLDSLHEDMQELKAVQREMAATFARLVLVEERQMNTSAALERAFKAIERIDTKLDGFNTANMESCREMERRLDQLEGDAPTNRRTSDWVFAGLIGFVALVAPKLIDRLF